MPFVSIVIATKDRGAMLGDCIESVLAQEDAPRFEVIVIDDGSTDGSDAVADEYASRAAGRIRVRKLAHVGLAAARNAGAEASSGRWLLFLDDDARLPAGFLAQLESVLHSHDGQVLGFADLPLPTDSYISASIRYLELASRRTIGREHAIKGAALACPRDLFLKLGGFDATRQYYQLEDTEFVARARGAGCSATWLPEPHVLHRAPTLSAYVRNNLRWARNVDVAAGSSDYRLPHLILALFAASFALRWLTWRRWRLVGAGGLALCGVITQVAAAPLRYAPGVALAAGLRACFVPLSAGAYLIARLRVRRRA